MSAESGWIAEPRPPKLQRFRSYASYRLGKIAEKDQANEEEDVRYLSDGKVYTWDELREETLSLAEAEGYPIGNFSDYLTESIHTGTITEVWPQGACDHKGTGPQ